MISRLAGPAFCLSALIAMPVHAMDVPQAPDISAFTLQEPAKRLGLHLVPSTTLGSGYNTAFYSRDQQTGALTLTTDGLQPVIRGKVAPETLLRENTAWYFQQTNSDMTATVHIDHFPRNGKVVIGRLASTQHPVAELSVQGDRVFALVDNGTSKQSVVVGTFYPHQTIRYEIHTSPNGLMRIIVNGTENHFSLPSAAIAQGVWFEAVVGEQGWHAPSHADMARVTFTGLQVHHEAA